MWVATVALFALLSQRHDYSLAKPETSMRENGKLARFPARSADILSASWRSQLSCSEEVSSRGWFALRAQADRMSAIRKAVQCWLVNNCQLECSAYE
jgi:hypothetical protein